MRDLIEHRGSGLMLDFAEDDFGGPEQSEIVREWRENRHHASPGTFVCYRHRDYERPWLYLQQRGGQLIAAHWPRSGLPEHRITHGVSDEHRRQVEYLQNAGEAAGFEVRTEVALPTRVRSDAVIYGPIANLGVEVQRSALTAAAAKRRTTQARRAGVEPVWFADSGSVPSWNWKVPSIRMNPEVPWDVVPSRRSVTVVSGVRIIVPLRCQDIPPDRNSCPRRRYRCNAWHAIHEPRLGIVVDDVAARFPAGELVPMSYRTFTRGDYILLVSPADKAQYEEIAGRSGDVPLRQPRQRLLQAGRVECAAPTATVGQIQPEPAGPPAQEPIPLPPVGTCSHYDEMTRSYCGANPTRRYLIGTCCVAHSPAALAGRSA